MSLPEFQYQLLFLVSSNGDCNHAYIVLFNVYLPTEKIYVREMLTSMFHT